MLIPTPIRTTHKVVDTIGSDSMGVNQTRVRMDASQIGQTNILPAGTVISMTPPKHLTPHAKANNAKGFVRKF